MKTVPLTQGYEALVDDDDYERVMQFSWWAEVRPNTVYAGSGLGRRGPRIRLHRYILNAPDGVQIDHKDRNGLNCQKHNLRYADFQTNGRNIIQPQGPNGSGFRGVYKHYYSERWIARIRDDSGKKLHIGTYGSPEEAARAYDEAAKLYHGEFAVLNFP